MKIDIVVVGPLETNCYLLRNEKSILIVDPGSDFKKIKQAVGNDNVVGILLTHTHFDHVGALEECKNEYDVPVYKKENLEEKEYNIEAFDFDVIFTPGHTNDSVIFYFKNENILFTGDFIFKGSIGRTDLGGNMNDMNKSFFKLFSLAQTNQSIAIYPGHGHCTNLNDELCKNPFLQIPGNPKL